MLLKNFVTVCSDIKSLNFVHEFYWQAEWTIFIALNSIKWLVFVMEKKRVFCGVEIEFLVAHFCFWIFQWHISFRPYHGPGVDSAPSENEYQEHSWW